MIDPARCDIVTRLGKPQIISMIPKVGECGKPIRGATPRTHRRRTYHSKSLIRN
jgi:hypothetical protein